MATSLPVFPQFDVRLDSNAGPRWTKRLTRFERLIVGMNITDATQKERCYYTTLAQMSTIFLKRYPTRVKTKIIKKAVECLNTYFVPKVNMVYEEY